MGTVLDFTPLFRSAIGFDRVRDLLEKQMSFEPADNYPPYNVAKTGPDAYRIALAVAGFTPEDLSIVTEQNVLTVSGRKQGADDAQYLHQGIAQRGFTRRFQLADYIKVSGANLENGMLVIDLVREVPEAMKPRKIEIRQATQLKAVDSQAADQRTIEGKKAA